ncbi:MAG: hypothetical protein H2212_07125 [Ruminococcus sp.]|nr:hypothetical protein [Ruminococcus sp.]
MKERTCRQCRRFEYCMEASRMDPCGDFRWRRWGAHRMSDAEITVMIAIAWLVLLIPAFV